MNKVYWGEYDCNLTNRITAMATVSISLPLQYEERWPSDGTVTRFLVEVFNSIAWRNYDV